jgi:hypothetical protein
MSITLSRFTNGDTNYVAKLNSDSVTLEGAVVSLETQLQAAAGASVSVGSALQALLGEQAAVVGDASYVPTPSGTDLHVAPGFFWRPSSATLSSTAGTTVLPFAGLAAATYYVQVDSIGSVTRSSTSTEAAYSVVWTGSAFGAITRTANVTWGAADWLASQTSTALGASYTSLVARLEAGEAAAAGKAPLASPTFTGVPAAPTAAGGTNTTQIATTAFVKTAVDNLVNAAPGALDTLKELADAIGDDANYAATVTTALALKAPLASPALTGTPTAPTAADGTNTTQVATTAFVTAAVAGAGSGTVTSVGVTAPAAGITSSGGPITSSGNITLALADDLAAVEGLSATGIVRRTASNTWSAGTAVNLTSEVTGVLPVANYATGTPSGAKFVRDDGVLAVPPGTGTGDALTTNPLSQFAATTSAQLASVISDETGSGALVFAVSPALTGTPTAPTASGGTNTTQLATTAFVTSAVAAGGATALDLVSYSFAGGL